MLGGHRVRLRSVDGAVPGAPEKRRASTASGPVAGVHHVVPQARRHDGRPVVLDVVRLVARVHAPTDSILPVPDSTLRNCSLCGS